MKRTFLALSLFVILCCPLSIGAQSLDPQRWRFQFSAGMPQHPKSPGWFFNFPQSPGHVNYVFTGYRRGLEGHTLTMAIAIQILSGAPKFNYLDKTGDCDTPATVRPYFTTGNMDDQFGRWWSYPTGIELQAGIFEIAIPFTPDRWSSVYGKFGDYSPYTLKKFRQAITNARSVGFTFGGGCNAGHGVRVKEGKARFLFLQYQID